MIADDVYRRGRAGLPSWLTDSHGRRTPLPIERWLGGAHSTAQDIRADEASIAFCSGPTLDLGCGPGRLTEALTRAGVPALGVDTSSVAVEMTNHRGGRAMQQDIFAALPGAGQWSHVLLADGNIGIGGDPAALLTTVRSLLHETGTAIVESAFEIDDRSTMVRWETGDSVGEWFSWASVGVSALYALAVTAGLQVRRTIESNGRVFMELAVHNIERGTEGL
ncbi:class I SAM-dependent methyltransferase [Rhodococcoides yunnanense]|uniref:Class I SAM-dependent methyltransferase n=1 Tax=Rhodococcoides yunnanense TaxID=278209 RepID=A0ABU4BG76_9NOCA|nr:class I SAM-dependent methyltransferase [Rhodococcus yunnanensis]MDV6263094.1 class I SAM-dependent methyltransferase [Rhodococcus yunnanensis]